MTRGLPSQHQRLANYASLGRVACTVAVSPALAAHLAGELPAQVPLPSSTVQLSGKVYLVKSLPPTVKGPVATVSRAAYDKAGVNLPPVAGNVNVSVQQRRKGRREGQGGRPVDTLRDTLKTLGVGMSRAMCEAIMWCGFDICVGRLYATPPPSEVKETLAYMLKSRADEFYRGEVWAWKHAFGVLSRYVAGTAATTERVRNGRAATVVTTWLSDVGVVGCSCVERTSHVGRLRSSFNDATCIHSKNFVRAVTRLCSRLGVSSSNFRVQIPQAFNLGGARAGEAGVLSTAQASEVETWDVEGPIETFRAGQESQLFCLGSGATRW